MNRNNCRCDGCLKEPPARFMNRRQVTKDKEIRNRHRFPEPKSESTILSVPKACVPGDVRCVLFDWVSRIYLYRIRYINRVKIPNGKSKYFLL